MQRPLAFVWVEGWGTSCKKRFWGLEEQTHFEKLVHSVLVGASSVSPGRTRRAVTRGVRSERLERGHTGDEGLGSAEPNQEDVGAEPERAGLERILLQPEKV